MSSTARASLRTLEDLAIAAVDEVTQFQGYTPVAADLSSERLVDRMRKRLSTIVSRPDPAREVKNSTK